MVFPTNIARKPIIFLLFSASPSIVLGLRSSTLIVIIILLIFLLPSRLLRILQLCGLHLNSPWRFEWELEKFEWWVYSLVGVMKCAFDPTVQLTWPTDALEIENHTIIGMGSWVWFMRIY
jgi:hypothetical protein